MKIQIMKLLVTGSSLGFVIVLASCDKDKQQSRYNEFAGHYLQAQHEYCSTNIFVAEQGVASFRQWVIDTNNPCEPWMNRDLTIFHMDARLFLIKEYLGETNDAEYFYHESVNALDKYLQHLQTLHLPDQPHPIAPISSKEQLRERLARQEKGLDVGWMKK